MQLTKHKKSKQVIILLLQKQNKIHKTALVHSSSNFRIFSILDIWLLLKICLELFNGEWIIIKAQHIGFYFFVSIMIDIHHTFLKYTALQHRLLRYKYWYWLGSEYIEDVNNNVRIFSFARKHIVCEASDRYWYKKCIKAII